MPTLNELVVADTPVLYWPMQETSGTATDASGNGRDGLCNGISYQAAGPTGTTIPYAYLLNEYGDYVRTNSVPGDLLRGPISMGGWFQELAYNSNGQVFGQPHSVHGVPYYTCMWHTGATLGWSLTPGLRWLWAPDSTITTAQRAAWHFIVSVWDTEYVWWYMDGVLVAQGISPNATDKGAGGSVSYSNKPFGLGHANQNLNTGYAWRCQASHVFLFSDNRPALTAEQVAAYYEASFV